MAFYTRINVASPQRNTLLVRNMSGEHKRWWRRLWADTEDGILLPDIDLSWSQWYLHLSILDVILQSRVPFSIIFPLAYVTISCGVPCFPSLSICDAYDDTEHGNELFFLSSLPSCLLRLVKLAKSPGPPIVWIKAEPAQEGECWSAPLLSAGFLLATSRGGGFL